MNNNFDKIYIELLSLINDQPLVENQRTNTKTKSIWGHSFRWDMKFYPLLNCRQMYNKTGSAELAWMLSGTKDISFMRKYSKIWDKFTDDDNDNEISTAYGHRWRHAFGVDQLKNIIEKLKVDPSSRQQVLMTWDPRVDNVAQAKNIPCPFCAVIGIVNGKLNLHLTVRSNDCVIGLPYDALVYTLLGNSLAKELGIPAGDLFYSIANAHIYDVHLPAIEPLLDFDYSTNTKYLIRRTMTPDEICNDPDKYVETIALDVNFNYLNDKPKLKFEIIK